VLALPAAQEEFNNARLVEERGAGLQLRRDQPPAAYADAMRVLLAGDRFRDAALAWGDAFRQEDRPLAAVEVFAGLRIPVTR
jgi:UDP:flavonoid glycosyltransferase YjiC (YdhE family)